MDLSEDLSGITFEWASPYPASNEKIMEIGGTYRALGKIIDHAANNNIPLFATDCAIKPLLIPFDGGLRLVEEILGLYLLTNAIDEKELTRRGFLKLLYLAGSAYLFTPFTARITRATSTALGIFQNESAELLKGVRRLHPEDGLVLQQLRDSITVEKMNFLLREKNQKHLLVTRGSLHAPIEDLIKSDDFRNKTLKKTSHFAHLVVDDTRTLYQIWEYEYSDEHGWLIKDIVEVPKLREIFAQRV